MHLETTTSFDLTPELQVVQHLLSRRLDVDQQAIDARQRLGQDLGLGLLKLGVLALELEDVTGVLLPFDALTRAVTVEDLARLLHAHRRRR
ncbi:MAG: hypothetical protein JNJ54_16770 [Myxococcaceae bacterium]|nr:hypothetical protein [Myxococcaceae bacterium]